MRMKTLALVAALVTPTFAAADDQKQPDEAKSDQARTKDTSPGGTTSTTRIDSKAGELGKTELQILAHIHSNDEMEVKAGKMAMQKGTTQAVKSYGKMLVDDHGANAQMIESLVRKQGKSLPSVQPVSEADKVDLELANETMAKLQSLDGKDFDREFLRSQVALHDKTLAKLNLDITKIQGNPDLVSTLRSMTPVLHEHLEKARTLLAADASAQPGA